LNLKKKKEKTSVLVRTKGVLKTLNNSCPASIKVSIITLYIREEDIPKTPPAPEFLT